HLVARALILAATMPLAAPSANRSTRLSPTRAEHVPRDLEGKIDLILDAGPATGGLESTVLDVTRTPPRLLRAEHITPTGIASIIGPIEVSGSVQLLRDSPLPAPGMMARHYSPRAPLELTDDSGWEQVMAQIQAGKTVGWLSSQEVTEQFPPHVIHIVMPTDP